jgi:hypothetical protein
MVWVIGIMFVGGVLGGAMSGLLNEPLDPGVPPGRQSPKGLEHWILAIGLGIGASVVVPLFLSFTSSSLIDQMLRPYGADTSSTGATKPDAVKPTAKAVEGTAGAASGAEVPGTAPKAESAGSQPAPARTAAPCCCAPGKVDESTKKKEGTLASPPRAEHLFFFGFCFLAALSARRFISAMTDRLFKQLEAAEKRIEDLKQNVGSLETKLAEAEKRASQG